jgi:hypothetical protein
MEGAKRSTPPTAAAAAAAFGDDNDGLGTPTGEGGLLRPRLRARLLLYVNNIAVGVVVVAVEALLRGMGEGDGLPQPTVYLLPGLIVGVLPPAHHHDFVPSVPSSANATAAAAGSGYDAVVACHRYQTLTSRRGGGPGIRQCGRQVKVRRRCARRPILMLIQVPLTEPTTRIQRTNKQQV